MGSRVCSSREWVEWRGLAWEMWGPGAGEELQGDGVDGAAHTEDS